MLDNNVIYLTIDYLTIVVKYTLYKIYIRTVLCVIIFLFWLVLYEEMLSHVKIYPNLIAATVL